MNRVIREVFPTVREMSETGWRQWLEDCRRRYPYHSARPRKPACNSISRTFTKAGRYTTGGTYLNFFKGFEYDPTPEVDAMTADVLIVGVVAESGVAEARRKVNKC